MYYVIYKLFVFIESLIAGLQKKVHWIFLNMQKTYFYYEWELFLLLSMSCNGQIYVNISMENGPKAPYSYNPTSSAKWGLTDKCKNSATSVGLDLRTQLLWGKSNWDVETEAAADIFLYIKALLLDGWQLNSYGTMNESLSFLFVIVK